MRAPLKILHLASFSGNIGDNANHSGFRPWLEAVAHRKAEWTELEIREFYWKERQFDESFVQLVSDFDLLVIGGGNYFELWVEHSATGTSIDIPPDVLARIRTPIFFNALGCDEGQGASATSLGRFRCFLEKLTASAQYLVTVRNDGAMATLRRHLPASLTENIHVIPDGGFFLQFAESEVPYLRASNRRIGINLASDMAEIRFRNFGKEGGYERFCDEFAHMLQRLAEEDPEIQYIFFPHIYRDLAIVSDIVSRLGDRLRRTRVSSAPYLTGPEGAQHIFGLYRECHLILGMRFHANVCALAMGVPAIGLCNYPQIKHLYREIGSPDKCVSVSEPGFSMPLGKRIGAALTDAHASAGIERAMGEVAHVRKSFEPRLAAWLQVNGLSEEN